MPEPASSLHPDLALLQRAYRRVWAVARRAAARHGLSPNGVALLELMQAAGGAVSPTEVSSVLGLSLQGVTALADRLEGKGYLERRLSAVDRRKRELTLTERGRRQAGAITAVFNEALEAALGGDEGQRARLRGALADLCRRLPAAGKGVETPRGRRPREPDRRRPGPAPAGKRSRGGP